MKLGNILIFTAALPVLATACIKISSSGSSSPATIDVTSDFLAQTGGHKYTIGPKKDNYNVDEVAINSDGSIKIKHNDTCPFIVTGTVTKVTLDNSAHYEITYTENDAQLSDKTDDPKCQKSLSDFKFNSVPSIQYGYACGYSTSYVDFGCSGDKNSFSNWILKN